MAESPSYAAHLGGIVRCPAPPIEGMSKEQLIALHRFKDGLTGLLNDLYKVVPQTKADDILRAYAALLP